MTGTLANAEQVEGLRSILADSPPGILPVMPMRSSNRASRSWRLASLSEERVRARFSAVRREESPSLHGYTLATLCRMHLAEPKLATRGAILAKGISTRADAIGALNLVAESDGDGELTDHVLASLRSFLWLTDK